MWKIKQKLGFKKHRKIWLGALLALFVSLLVGFYHIWLSRTKIALVNFQPVMMQALSQADDNPFIKLYDVKTDELGSLDDYDVVLINGMGLNITAEQRQQIQETANEGVPVYTMMATNPDNDISNFTVEETALIQKYMMGGRRKNNRSLLSFLRRNVDGKIIFTGTPEKPEQKPSDYLFFPTDNDEEEELEFTSVSSYEKYMKTHGLFRKGAKKVVVSGAVTDPTDLVRALVKEGYNVYPVSSFMNMADFIRQIRPDMVINSAHGRLGDDVVQYLKANNILLFDPMDVNALTDDWEKDPRGMMGGFLSQSVVMPEIDGAIRTTALFGLTRDKNGLLHPYAVPERLETFIKTVNNYSRLTSKKNKDKRLAIVYFKGPGQSNLVASGMNVAQSLYNILLNLKKEGYNLSGLPASLTEFKQQIAREGSLFNSFAEGDVARYMKIGHPQLVTKQEYDSWTHASLRKQKIEDVDKEFGKFPGDHNKLKTADGRLAFPRIRYGNIVLIPQPLAGEGKDVFKIVHGTDKVPPHSYIAPYLWIQYGFKADALLHFGTHGSLEFTPQKQVALSNNDWPDRLVGALPHFYYYTIDNVGEAMIAKRRSYAGLLSYLTPAFHESELRNTYKNLEDKLSVYFNNKGNKHALAVEAKQLAIQLGIHKDLGLDGDLKRVYNDTDLQRLADYAEELSSEKITDTPYVMGVPYSQEDIRSTIFSMTVDPIAYSLYSFDKQQGKAPADLYLHKAKFNALYLKKAESLVNRFYTNPSSLTDGQLLLITGLTTAQLQKAHDIEEKKNMPKGMMAMMMAASRKDKKHEGKAHGGMMGKMENKDMEVPAPSNSPIAKFMRYQMRKMLAKKDPTRMLAVAKKMGASPEALKKMEEGLKKQMGNTSAGRQHATETDALNPKDIEFAHAVTEVETSLRNIGQYKELLVKSPSLELASLVNALNGGYTAPSPGGDLILNPNTLPTGRNLFAINAEETPTPDAWEKGIALAKNTIDEYRRKHRGEYPRKVSYTLWSGEFIQTGGATIAQVLYMLGVEPVRDRYGRVSDIKLIPSSALGRPRIDVVVQTSGQLRDLAASRLFLITRAVKMAAAADDDKFTNEVKVGVEASERYLIDKGVSPKEARELSHYRVFGGAGGGYGTGIQGMVEQGNRWTNERQIAETYINNMGAFYGDEEHWMNDVHEAFGAALTRTDVVVQPRQNNTWGALSLDHVYEFMGGVSLVVRHVTGKDPEAYFSDYRNRNNYRMQDSKEAIGVEARTKILNPSYVKRALSGGENATDEIAEMVRNTYGWNVMKPRNIDKELWDEIYNVYIKDKYDLGIKEQFAKVNPTAMEEMTATMMETARKGYWKASPQQLADIATLHTELVTRFGPSGSSFEGNNRPLQDFIAGKAPAASAKTYLQRNRQMTVAAQGKTNGKSMVMKKETDEAVEDAAETSTSLNGVVIVSMVFAAFIVMLLILRRKRKNER